MWASLHRTPLLSISSQTESLSSPLDPPNRPTYLMASTVSPYNLFFTEQPKLSF